jgi:glutamate---cysteine ligase / carboxylate-amine ligase
VTAAEAERDAERPNAFGSTRAGTVGLEEELLLVDAELRLAHDSAAVLERMGLPDEQAGHEAFQAEIELRSGPCQDSAGAVRGLADGRAAVLAAGATPLAVGLHPDARFGEAPLVRADRYERVEAEMRGLIGRTPECALHVHVGVPDREAAVRALMGVREALPLISALGASSPFWFGRDSGLASARAAMVRSYPGRGAPPAMRSWDDYEQALADIAAGGGPSDYTMVWWDVRLQPRLGTVELRELDVQARLDDAAALAALVRGIALRAIESPVESPAPAQALAWSWFRAARDGLDAEVHNGGDLVPVRKAARDLAAALGEDPALEGIERMLREGSGADRQRAAHARGGMPALLELLRAETARPLGG